MADQQLAPEYVVARRSLLDALELLADQREALVLVGAQAVYLRAPAVSAGQTTFTTDADLALDPDLLSTAPDVGQVLLDSGYRRGRNPGAFIDPRGVELDIMVPEGAAPPSPKRGVPLPGQHKATARRTHGLELALIDWDWMPVPALDATDPRVLDVKVAGPAALAVAKLIKISERVAGNKPDRVKAKDAGDLLRLLRFNDAAAIGARLAELVGHPGAEPAVNQALTFLEEGTRAQRSELLALTVAASGSAEPAGQTEQALRTLATRLLDSYRSGLGGR